MSATDKIHTRLGAHGWTLTSANTLHYFYQRGDQWIELEPDGCAYFGVDDRRMSNGTHEQVVSKFGETPDPAQAIYAHETLDRLEAFWKEHIHEDDPRNEAFYAGTKKLRDEIDRLAK